jgi:hypothetical protein
MADANKNYPSWYTPEDIRAADVLQGLCRGCAHFGLVQPYKGKFEGLWCGALEKKLDTGIEQCEKFYPQLEKLGRIIKELGLGYGNY